MLFSKYSKNYYNLQFSWKNVNKQLKSADFFSEKSKFCLDFFLNKTSTHGDNKSSMKSNPSTFLVLKIFNQSCTVCVDWPCICLNQYISIYFTYHFCSFRFSLSLFLILGLSLRWCVFTSHRHITICHRFSLFRRWR